MARKLISTLVLATLGLGSAHAQAPDPPPDAPWGYLYSFRLLKVYPLSGNDSRIGRLPENQVALPSPRVSRRHAAVRLTEDGVHFVDIGSSNGSRVNGRDARARLPVPLEPGDRVQVADELLLFHTSLSGLWDHELRLRLLTSMVRLNVDLPQDFTQKSLGREQVVAVSTDAVLDADMGEPELTYHAEGLREGGFGKEGAAFVGNVELADGVLELSLWGIEGKGSMTSRRSSISRLKHTTLRVSIGSDGGTGPATVPAGPWFPSERLAPLFDVFEDDRSITLRFSTSLARQERLIALKDGSACLAFRHQLNPEDWELLVQAAQSQGTWVEQSVVQRRMALTAQEREQLAVALAESRARLDHARSLGAKGKPVADAESIIERASTRLDALNAQ